VIGVEPFPSEGASKIVFEPFSAFLLVVMETGSAGSISFSGLGAFSG
jgi:hypothetical protein